MILNASSASSEILSSEVSASSFLFGLECHRRRRQIEGKGENLVDNIFPAFIRVALNNIYTITVTRRHSTIYRRAYSLYVSSTLHHRYYISCAPIPVYTDY